VAASRRGAGEPPSAQNLKAGWGLLAEHPSFRHIRISASVCAKAHCALTPRQGYAHVTSDGLIHANMWRRADPPEWAWVLAHVQLHLGFGHAPASAAEVPPPDEALAAARCAVVNRFLAAFKISTAPVELPQQWPGGDEEALAALWRTFGIPAQYACCGTVDEGADHSSVLHRERHAPPQWPQQFSTGLSRAVSDAIGGADGSRERRKGPWDAALSWFVSSFPLLGAIAAGLRVVADTDLALSEEIWIAAVDASAGKIYVNPLIQLDAGEWRFVLAHEMLHAALRHGDRVGGRDPYLWNIACDYVVNSWLIEMHVGVMPDGALHDPALAGHSAEQVYDLIASDLRRIRKLSTLRGRGRGDVLSEPLPSPGQAAAATDLDEFYRRALTTGRLQHRRLRGDLPAGLEQEIRALEQPPIPWDAKLARWFDEHVPAAEPRRSYARPSRRQSATPDIPRPGRWTPEEPVPRRTFGVVLDTSMSMQTRLLGKALGAIASFAAARDVPAARVVFCDAAAYDAGYLPVEQIAAGVRVHGRGGTRLQPAVGLLQHAEDFPPDAPILVITDGECDVLTVRREHAYLMPRDARLPFTPRGPVFSLR
jgi:predicted metal-dependent peptidase